MLLQPAIAGLLLTVVTAVSAAATDPVTGLRLDDDWQLVRNNCLACHSAKLITQQRGSAAQWLTMIRWMQAEQNLWEFDSDTEQRIVDYLARNYPPRANRRRAPIPPQLMPESSSASGGTLPW